MSAQGFLGAGDLYVARFVGGVQQDWKGPYETNKFALTTASELKELESKGKTTYGQIVESVPIQKPAELSAEFTRIDNESLVLALLGTNSAVSVTGATITDEVFVAPALDTWKALAHGKISSVVVTNSAASTTYVLGTDYLVNAELGMLKILPGGAITAAQSLKVDYTYASYTGNKIAGATNAQLRAAFMFDGINQVDGLPAIVNVWECIMTSSGEFDFLSADFNKVPLTGKMKTPVGKTEPFTVEMRNT